MQYSRTIILQCRSKRQAAIFSYHFPRFDHFLHDLRFERRTSPEFVLIIHPIPEKVNVLCLTYPWWPKRRYAMEQQKIIDEIHYFRAQTITRPLVESRHFHDIDCFWINEICSLSLFDPRDHTDNCHCCMLWAMQLSKRSFKCMSCSKEFKPKWNELLFAIHSDEYYEIKGPFCGNKGCIEKGS